jgi:hypothetical protein
MAKEKPVPTEKTPKGYEVPIPKRADVLANLRKVARMGKRSTPRGPKK